MDLGHREGWTPASRSSTGRTPGLDTSHLTPAKVGEQLLAWLDLTPP